MHLTKIAVITGGSKGIGRETTLLFARNNYKVFVLDIEKPAYHDDNIFYMNCDVTNIQEIDSTIATVIEKVSYIDVLVNNAGVHLSANIENTSEEDYDRVMDINFKGCFFILKVVLPYMRERKKGTIVLLGSDQSFVGKPNNAIYGATKGAIAQLTKSTALDYAKYNIRVNCVCAGTIDTPLYRNAIEEYSKKSGIALAEIEGKEAALQPLARIGKPEEVAELVYFLCSDKADFITGGLFPIDGGYTTG
jgi:NAD(P)-dependent dehydrogenase (short-subunit alcohol dehydrogenase family)